MERLFVTLSVVRDNRSVVLFNKLFFVSTCLESYESKVVVNILVDEEDTKFIHSL